MKFEIIAYPDGAREVVGRKSGGSAEGVVMGAIAQAKVRGEYVEVERDGKLIATVGPEGPVADQ